MRAFRIGRVFGIELRVDWSWVFIFGLITWNLTAVFTRWHPHWSSVQALMLATVASLTFFGCTLLHELAHSVVAMGHGLRVRSITLFLFGGVSNIEREPPSAGAEFLIAIVGPVTSIALGIGFLGIAALVMPVSLTSTHDAWNALARLGPVPTLLVWLGPINIMIGLFNMIPGFPLDGGRVLRAVLWSITGDFRTATLWASATGKGISWLFIASGIAMSFGAHLPVFGTGVASGLWLALIGWFLHGAAAQATTRLALDDAFSGMTVEQLMQRDVVGVPPDLSVAALVHDHIVPGDERAFPVMRDGKFLGLVAISDVRTLHTDTWATTPVASVMRGLDSVSTVLPETPLEKAFEELAQKDIGQLPVVVGGVLVGMLRRRDVTRWLELAWKPGASGAHAWGASATRRPGREIPMRGPHAHHSA